jgi:transcription elongation GreA/GreB family factor
MTSQSIPLLTPAGRDRLQQRLQSATSAFQAVCADNEVAATCGETSVWHDSFDYEENQRQMHMLARQVQELRRLLQTAHVTDPRRLVPRCVEVGCVVAYRIGEGAVQEWHIAGWDDGDPKLRRLAYNSPLGQVLLGAEPGELREWRCAGKVQDVEILRVGPGPKES